MRIVIDKDVSEIQKINESWKKDRPTFKVLAVNKYDKFVYAKDLKRVYEAVSAVSDMLHEEAFYDCQPEVYEVRQAGERMIWSFQQTINESSNDLVEEGLPFGDFFKKLGTKLTQFGQNTLNAWRKSSYINKKD